MVVTNIETVQRADTLLQMIVSSKETPFVLWHEKKDGFGNVKKGEHVVDISCWL